MKIFLTGGSGMVGRNILEHPEASKYSFLAPSSQQLNLLDRKGIAKFLRAEAPDIVIHCAGRVGGIQANMASPLSFLVENLEIGKNVIAQASQSGVPMLLNVASSCMYPRAAKNPLTEEMVLTGELEPTNEGYALAKIVTAKLCEYIAQEDVTKIYRTVIPCNLYGLHDKFDPEHSHLLPAVIKKIHDAKVSGEAAITIWGDGSARREFMYATDLADFIFFALANLHRLPQNLNVGLGHDFSITDYYETVARVVGFRGRFQFDRSKPVGMKQKLVDISKLTKLGWSHKTSLEEGIAKTYMFYTKGLDNAL